MVVSNLVIHNIPAREGQYQAEFEKARLKISPESQWSWGTFPPLRVDKGDEDVSVTDLELVPLESCAGPRV